MGPCSGSRKDLIGRGTAMRAYMHHLGDWAAHTAHLGWMEKAAYHLLIETYYLYELPLPGDYNTIYRLLPAITAMEREAVRHVLSEFFTLETDGRWHQKRCDAEIARQQKMSNQQRSNVNQRWNGRANEEGKLSTNDPNLSTHLSRHDDFDSVAKMMKRAVPELACKVNLSFAPEQQGALGSKTNGYDGKTAVIPPGIPPMNHEPLIHKKRTEVEIARARQAAESARQFGFEVNDEDPRLIALLADGATPGEVALAAAKAQAAGKPWAYAIGTLAGMRKDAAAIVSRNAQEGPKTGPGSPYAMLPRAGDPYT